jgi:anti-anti-sigma regulatory factor
LVVELGRKETDTEEARSGVAYRDKQLVVWRRQRPSGLRLIGVIDAFNVQGVEEVLADALNGESDYDVHIDLSLIEFVDVSGIRALVAAAGKAEGRHRVILHGLPPLMSKVMGVVGWSDSATLLIAQEEFPQAEQED